MGVAGEANLRIRAEIALVESPNGEGEGGHPRVAPRNEEEEEDGEKEGKVPADNEGGRHPGCGDLEYDFSLLTGHVTRMLGLGMELGLLLC